MRLLLFASAALALAGSASGQPLSLKAPALQHVMVVGTASAQSAPPGGAVTLWAEVTPKANIHVYAPGAKDFTPVALVMTPRPGASFSKASYPAGELSATAGGAEPVPVYNKTFRITQPVVLPRSLKTGETIMLAGALNYQACDDRLCYPTASIPVMWSLKVQ